MRIIPTWTPFFTDSKESCIQSKAHPDLDAVFSLKFGDVFVSPGQFGAVERPEAAHHLDAGLRRVRHVAMLGWNDRSSACSVIAAGLGGEILLKLTSLSLKHAGLTTVEHRESSL